MIENERKWLTMIEIVIYLNKSEKRWYCVSARAIWTHFRDFKRETVSHCGRTDRKTEHLRVHDTKGFKGIKPTRSFDQGSCWEIYSDQKIFAKADKKAKQLKAEKKYRSKEFKAMYNEIKSVLQKNYQLAVPLKKGTLVSEEQFVTITSLGINDKVSVMDESKKLTSDVDLDTVVDEIQAEAVKDSFWNTIMIAPDKTNLTDK